MEHQNPLPSGFCFQKLLGRKLTSLFFELKNHFLGHGEEGTWAEAEKKAEEREEIASTALMAEFQVGIGQEASRITCHVVGFTPECVQGKDSFPQNITSTKHLPAPPSNNSSNFPPGFSNSLISFSLSLLCLVAERE